MFHRFGIFTQTKPTLLNSKPPRFDHLHRRGEMSLHDAQEQYAVGGHQLADRQQHDLFEFFAAIMPTGAFAFAARGPSAEFPTGIGERNTVVPAR
jgi:hypothetical protein